MKSIAGTLAAPFPYFESCGKITGMITSSIDSFWAKVAKSDCWLWTAGKNEKGYGVFGAEGRTRKAHRIAYELTNGAIPAGLCVLHKCDVPACCNPDHLFLGTRAENNADMVTKGRHVPGSHKTNVDQCAYKRGEQHHASKLTGTDVLAIRADREAGLSFSELGKKYGINGSAAFKICKKLLWRNI